MTKPTKKTQTKTKTRFLGVYALDEGRWMIRAVARHPVTGRQVSREKVVECPEVEQARDARESLSTELLHELTSTTTHAEAATVADYAERWIARKALRLRPGVVDAYIDILGKRVLPGLGGKTVKTLCRADIEAWVAWAERQQSSHKRAYSRETLSGWWRVLCNFVRDAAADFEIPDPTRRIRPPTSQVRNVSEHRSLSAVQLGALLACVEQTWPQWYPEVCLIAFTGMRPSELYGLKWEDVDLGGGLIGINRSVDTLRRVENPPKTGTPREVALTTEMKEMLQIHRQKQLRDQHPGLASGLIFPNAEGGYRGSSALLNLLRLAAKTAGIPVLVGPKTMRKTFITLAALSGNDRLAIRANVGHCDEEMTERYAWVSPEEKRKVVEHLQALIGRE